MTAHPLTYAQFATMRDAMESDIKAAGVTLRGFGTGNAGLTPDAVKAMPEWQAAKAEFNQAFRSLQTLNRAHLARFKAEETERRNARRK